MAYPRTPHRFDLATRADVAAPALALGLSLALAPLAAADASVDPPERPASTFLEGVRALARAPIALTRKVAQGIRTGAGLLGQGSSPRPPAEVSSEVAEAPPHAALAAPRDLRPHDIAVAEGVQAARWIPGRPWILYVDGAGVSHLYDLDRGGEVWSGPRTAADVVSITVDSTGRNFALADSDGGVSLRLVASGQEYLEFKVPVDPWAFTLGVGPTEVALAENGNTVFARRGGDLVEVDVAKVLGWGHHTLQWERSYPPEAVRYLTFDHESLAGAIAYRPDGQGVLVGGRSGDRGAVRSYGAPLLPDEPGSLLAAQVVPEGGPGNLELRVAAANAGVAVFASADDRHYLWRPGQLTELPDWLGAGPVALSGDGRVAAVGQEGSVQVFDLDSGRLLRTLPQGTMTDAVLGEDGTRVALWSADEPVLRWAYTAAASQASIQ